MQDGSQHCQGWSRICIVMRITSAAELKPVFEAGKLRNADLLTEYQDPDCTCQDEDDGEDGPAIVLAELTRRAEPAADDTRLRALLSMQRLRSVLGAPG
jgi:hypothetical protein